MASASGRVIGALEAAVSWLLVIWSDYSWLAVTFLTLVLAVSIVSFVRRCGKEKENRCKVGI